MFDLAHGLILDARLLRVIIIYDQIHHYSSTRLAIELIMQC